jgi:UDPglucose 6-dehydrogenase
MLASRVSFMNELSHLCEKLGADIDQIRIGMGMDSRIGNKFLYSGPGYGGSCFPKDVSALIHSATKNDVDFKILKSTREANECQKLRMVHKIQNVFPDLKAKTFAIWGLAFKAGTDDVRESPSLVIGRQLIELGASLVVHDPKASRNFAKAIDSPRVRVVEKAFEALDNADALILLTEWSEYRNPNWEKVSKALREKVVFDFRNQWQFKQLKAYGFSYFNIGRPDSSYSDQKDAPLH